MAKQWICFNSVVEIDSSKHGVIVRFITDNDGCYEFYKKTNQLLVVDKIIGWGSSGKLDFVSYGLEEEYTDAEVDLSRIKENYVSFVAKNKEGEIVTDIVKSTTKNVYSCHCPSPYDGDDD